MMNSAKKSDETVVVDGKTISKMDVGDEAFNAYSKMADLEARMAKSEKEAAFAKFEKRATVELPNLIGTDVEKAHALMAVDALDDDIAKSAITAILKAANEANAGDFEKRGVSGDAGETGALSEIKKKADEIAKRDNITEAEALAKAWVENPSLYEQYEKEAA